MKYKVILGLFIVIFSVSIFAQTAQKERDQKMMQVYGLTTKDMSNYNTYVKTSNEHLQKEQDAYHAQMIADTTQAKASTQTTAPVSEKVTNTKTQAATILKTPQSTQTLPVSEKVTNTKTQAATILKTPQSTQTSSGWKINYN